MNFKSETTGQTKKNDPKVSLPFIPDLATEMVKKRKIGRVKSLTIFHQEEAKVTLLLL
jgi:hypothetical protein